MTENRKQTGTRKNKKAATQSGQKSLLDLFSVKQPLTRFNSPSAAASPKDSENEIRTASSSDVELVDMPALSSSPVATDVECVSDEGIFEVSFGSQGVAAAARPKIVPRRLRADGSGSNVNTKTSLRPRGSRPTTSRGSLAMDEAEGQSRDAPIVIDSSPVRPLKPVEPTKPLYPIFITRPVPSDARPLASKHSKAAFVPFPDEHAQHVRGPQSSFHAPDLVLERRAGSSCLQSGRLATYLDATVPPHVQETQGTPPIPGSSREPSSRKNLGSPSTSADSTPLAATSSRTSDFHQNRLCQTSGETTSLTTAPSELPSMVHVLDNIPTPHRSRPAIRRLFESPQEVMPQGSESESSGSSSQLWTDKWRPRRADETIGNEAHALYLRAWLLALKVHMDAPLIPNGGPSSSQDSRGKRKKRPGNSDPRASNRPQVLRQVDKRRKRLRLDSEDPDDGWMAQDESEEELHSGLDDDEDELAFCQQTLARLQRVSAEVEGDASLASDLPREGDADCSHDFSYATPRFGNQIHNTILLSGPSGCGKTAAVYACAEELGWDVFEVYPGICERSGAALNKLIGEMGKNHLVKQTQRQQTKLSFGSGYPSQLHANDSVLEGRPRRRRLARINSGEPLRQDAQDLPGSPADPDDGHVSPSQPRAPQSIILIEEADVLYESDANFWPSLINIIKDCRRPVVITCNDVSLIPVSDLPLQDILKFSPCPAALTVSYLQCILFIERQPMERESIAQLYAPVDGTSEKAADLRTASSSTVSFDLRYALNQLQFGGPEATSGGQEITDHIPNYAGTLGHHQDELSLLDLQGTNITPQAVQALVQRSPDLRSLRRMSREQEACSFVDSFLRRQAAEVLTDSVMEDTCTANDELGYRILRDGLPPSASSVPVNQSFYYRDRMIVDEALGPRQNSMCILSTDLHGYARAAQEYAAQMVAILDDLQTPSDVLMDGAMVFLDYDPWVRYMVAVDDANAAACAESQAVREGVRKTRNSQKTSQPVRHIQISESHRWTLARTAFHSQ